METEKEAAESRWSRDRAEERLLSALADAEALIEAETSSHDDVISALDTEEDGPLRAILKAREENRHVSALSGLHDRRLRILTELNRLSGLYGDRDGDDMSLPVFEGEEDIQE